MWLPGAREQEAEVVVNLRYGADGRPGVFRGGLLLDGDSGGKSFDTLNFGLTHLFEKLAGVCRETLDVTPLSLCVDGVEGER